MINDSVLEKCTEVYEIEKTIEVVVTLKSSHEPRHVRIEALRDLSNNNKYSTTAYVRENILVQPTYPRSNGNFDRKHSEMEIWIDYDLPCTDGDSADAVLTRALGFLRERCE